MAGYANTFTKVAEVQGSAATPYVVSRCDQTGELSCTCPGWKFSGQKRGCKHTKAHAASATTQPTLPVAPAPAPTATRPVPSQPAIHNIPIKPTPAVKAVGDGVMLAHTWDGRDDITGWWLSEKLDGVRARWDSKRRVFVSRAGNEYAAPAFFTENLPPVDLDGELWMGRGKFNECSGICRRSVSVGASAHTSDWAKLTYVVFDSPQMSGTFEERLAGAREILLRCQTTYAVVHEFVRLDSMADLPTLLATVEQHGGEGLMARKPGDAVHTTRTRTLLKIKTFKDAEAKVVGHEPGEGKHAGRLGALRCVMADGPYKGAAFKVGTGFTDKEREAPPPIGATITFAYFELSKDGVPRFPAYKGVRDYE